MSVKKYMKKNAIANSLYAPESWDSIKIVEPNYADTKELHFEKGMQESINLITFDREIIEKCVFDGNKFIVYFKKNK